MIRDIDIGKVAMSYLETHVTGFRYIMNVKAGTNFIDIRDAFASSWCHCPCVGNHEPHTYGVTSFGLHASDTYVSVAAAGALLHAIVRHEYLHVPPEHTGVARVIEDALNQLNQRHDTSTTQGFFNPFDVKCVLMTAQHASTRGVRRLASAWIASIESAGARRRGVAAHKIARAITNSNMFKLVMERVYIPGGRVAKALAASFSREFINA